MRKRTHKRTMRLLLITIGVLALTALVGIGAAYAAQGTPLGNGNGPGDAVPGEYIVVLQPDADGDAVAAAHGVAKGRAFTAVFNGFAGKVPPGRVAALRSDPRVLSVSPNRVVSAHE